MHVHTRTRTCTESIIIHIILYGLFMYNYVVIQKWLLVQHERIIHVSCLVTYIYSKYMYMYIDNYYFL